MSRKILLDVAELYISSLSVRRIFLQKPCGRINEGLEIDFILDSVKNQISQDCLLKIKRKYK